MHVVCCLNQRARRAGECAGPQQGRGRCMGIRGLPTSSTSATLPDKFQRRAELGLPAAAALRYRPNSSSSIFACARMRLRVIVHRSGMSTMTRLLNF